MFHFTSGPALVVEAGLAVFCFVDVMLAPEEATRVVARWAWALGLLLLPAVVSIIWLVTGRPRRARIRSAGHRTDSHRTDGEPGRRPAAPARPQLRELGRIPIEPAAGQRKVADGAISPWPPDPGLVGELWEINEEHERTLRLWEADLRRREQNLRATGAAGEVDVA